MPSHIKTITQVFDKLTKVIQSKLDTYHNEALPSDISQKLFHPQRTELMQPTTHANKTYNQAYLTNLNARYAATANKRSQAAELQRKMRFENTEAANQANQAKLKSYQNPSVRLTRSELETYKRNRKVHFEDLTQAMNRRHAGSNAAIIARLKSNLEASCRVAADNPVIKQEMAAVEKIRQQSNFDKNQFARLFNQQVLPNREKKVAEVIRAGFATAIDSAQAVDETVFSLGKK